MEEQKIIKIEYECDVSGDHTCNITEITNIHKRIFTDKMEAIHFIGECTSCSHNIKDVYPELYWWENDVDDDIECSNKDLEEFISFKSGNKSLL